MTKRKQHKSFNARQTPLWRPVVTGAAVGAALSVFAVPASWPQLAGIWADLSALASAFGHALPAAAVPPIDYGGLAFARLALSPAHDQYLRVCGALVALFAAAGAASWAGDRARLHDGTWVGGRRAASSTHGDAWLASSPREIRSACRSWHAGRAPSDGDLVVGALGDDLMLASVVQATVLGKSGDGKSRRVVIPSIVANVLQGRSLVVNDVKGELWAYTAPWVRSLGTHRVVRVAFDDPATSARFDPLARARAALERGGVGACTRELRELARCVVPRSLKGQQYFSDAARNIFVGLALHVLAADEVPDAARNLSTVLALVTPRDGADSVGRISELLSRIDPGSPDAPFLNGVDGTGGGGAGVVNTLTNALVAYVDRDVAPMLVGDEVGLDRVGEEPTVVYISSSSASGDRSALVNTLFSQALAALRSCAARHHGSVPVRTLLLMDEFASMGRCERLLQDLGEMRSENVSVVACWQSFHQLEAVAHYEPEEAKLMLDLMSDKVVLSCGDVEVARELSETIGDYTAVSETSSRSRGQQYSSTGSSESTVRRPLISPAEMMEWTARDTGTLLIRGSETMALPSRDVSETFVAGLLGMGTREGDAALRKAADDAREDRNTRQPEVWAGPDGGDEEVPTYEVPGIDFGAPEGF